MIYQHIKNQKTHSVKKMAKIFGVSRSGYYKWMNKPLSKREKENILLVNEINEIQNKCRYSYGSPGMTRHLKSLGRRIGKNRVARLMKLNCLNFKMKKKFKLTTNSAHSKKFSPDLLKREFNPDLPNKVWVSDFTYLWTKEGWLYICIILDLFSRKVIGWSAGKKIDTDLLLKAFNIAVIERKSTKGLLFHSDRGIQYCSKKFRNVLDSYDIKQSMSRKGNCWDNACAESFFKSLKTEWLYDNNYETRELAKKDIFEYIEIFYNRFRKHSTLGIYSPSEYEDMKMA